MIGADSKEEPDGNGFLEALTNVASCGHHTTCPPSASLGIGADSSVCALDGIIRW